MKNNIIKNTREKELEARREAQRVAARQAELEAVEPKNIIDTMNDIGSQIVVCRDDEGAIIGVNGGKYYQVPIEGGTGTIASKTEAGLEHIRERMSRGIMGDGLLHKLVIIRGLLVDCVGATEQELEDDIRHAEEFAQAHGNNMVRNTDIAEQLVDAGYAPEDLEQIEVEGETYILVYPEKRLMDFYGNTLVECEDITSTLQRKELKAILLDRLSGKKQER